MTALIPADVKLAAKRGFLRTTYQSYATALAGGVSATALLAVANGEVALVPTIVTVGVAAVSPLLAGLVSYLSISANGIPGEYAPETTGTGRVVTTAGQAVEPGSAGVPVRDPDGGAR